MNRQILFRGKRVDDGEWIEGYFLQLHRSERAFIVPKQFVQRGILRMSGETPPKIIPIEVLPETVGQFTGLTDKNGKKIFENDIIADDEEYSTFENTRKGIVKFYHGEFTSFYGQDLLGRDCYDPLYSVCKERYVIGNIYDNPELEEE